MALDGENLKTRFEALSSTAVLDVIVPGSSSVDINGLLRDGKVDNTSRLPTRRNLFFGTAPERLCMAQTY